MKSLRVYSVAGYGIMVLALILLIFVRGLFSSLVVVIAVQILAAMLMVWARVTFGSRSFHFAADATKGGLVTTGPYKYIRHPIYAAVLLFTVAGVLGNFSWLNAGLFVLLCFGVGIRIFCEERLVQIEYPEYTEYAGRTKRIIPLVF